ncbi:hypothetical protein RRG08_054904 [Elysia crispata]|uniref:Uncharacterized protein n=1 Tax=Elysia crispata TaxID=231223 RepID=A0AAE1A5H6_9GAST|nr:hypothetical protein RRG08_054904 [Elysia crispata]
MSPSTHLVTVTDKMSPSTHLVTVTDKMSPSTHLVTVTDKLHIMKTYGTMGLTVLPQNAAVNRKDKLDMSVQVILWETKNVKVVKDVLVRDWDVEGLKSGCLDLQTQPYTASRLVACTWEKLPLVQASFPWLHPGSSTFGTCCA